MVLVFQNYKITEKCLLRETKPDKRKDFCQCSLCCVLCRTGGTMVTYGGMAKQPVTVPVVS